MHATGIAAEHAVRRRSIDRPRRDVRARGANRATAVKGRTRRYPCMRRNVRATE
jgi:hypothetical protein